MSSRNSKDLVITVLFTFVALGNVFLQSNGVLAWSLVALPLVLILPGYALTAALFPEGSLGRGETLASSLGLSLAADIVGGAILNMTSEGLTPLSWTVLLAGVALAGCVLAMLRRRGQPAPTARLPALGLNGHATVFFMVSIAVIVVALIIVRDESLQPHTAFTELWAKPAAFLGQTAFDVGVRNSESVRMEYRVEVRAGGVLVDEPALIVLTPGETWQKLLTFQTLVTGDVQVLLYRMDEPGRIYRQVVSRGGTQ